MKYCIDFCGDALLSISIIIIIIIIITISATKINEFEPIFEVHHMRIGLVLDSRLNHVKSILKLDGTRRSSNEIIWINRLYIEVIFATHKLTKVLSRLYKSSSAQHWR